MARKSTASKAGKARVREPWTRLSPEQRRVQIVECAGELFGARHYEELAIADVASAAGVTQGLIYHYFPNKQSLFLAAFEARAKDLLSGCLPEATLPLPVQVERGVRGYLDFVEAHSVAYLNLFRGATASEPEVMRICDDARQVIIERFIQACGLADANLPATRLSLRGYLGYSESVVLAWLEQRAVPRASLERMLFAIIGTALSAGLASDAVEPPGVGSLAAFEQVYREYFALR